MSVVYFKSINGKKSRPYTIEELSEKGNLFESELIWREGLTKWTKAKDIEELSIYAIKEPPKTTSENKKYIFKYSTVLSLKYYIIFSLFIGVFSALLENYQYNEFINSIDKIDHSNDVNSSLNQNGGGYSDVKNSEIFASREDGSRYTRWTSYSAFGNQNKNEQISYEENYKFLFRPYKAIFDVVNLSNDERESVFLLLYNFVLSSLVTNIFFFPILLLIVYKLNYKNYR